MNSLRDLFYVILCVTILSFSTTMANGQLKHNAKTPVDPATSPLPAEERGTVINGTIENSTIYPGTKRNYQVFVPKQYDGKTPACLVVGLDGNLFNAITVIDNLINKGDMPVTIGLFIDPGVCYDADGEVIRYNRSNEFDRTNYEFASFLETEVLPLLNSLETPDGRKIIISDNPNDRGITGASSSGIAAFSVAWHRPDLFSRVYSSVGTFVAMRGGNEYPAIIRKTEPKSLRIFLQDGVNDTWNHIFGDWWEYNQLMASALNFAGYEFDYKWDKGTHSIYYGTRAYPDAMRWLWRDWPSPVTAGQSMNGMLESLLIEGEGWKMRSLEEVSDMCIENTAELQSNYKKYVKDGFMAISLYNGDSYISTTEGKIYLLKKGAKKAILLNTLKNSGEQIAIYPNHKLMVTTEENSNWLISYIINEDGTITAGERFYWLHNMENHTHTPFGNIVFDTLGNLYISSTMGIQVCDQNGRVRAILPFPEHIRSTPRIEFIGNKLYLIWEGKTYVRTIKNTGYCNWQQPVDIKSQGQG